VSPEYLNRFMTYVDSLLWLEQVNSSSGSSVADGSRADGAKKPGRGKSTALNQAAKTS